MTPEQLNSQAAATMAQRIGQLTMSLVQAEAAASILDAENAALEADNAKLKAQVEDLTAQVAKLTPAEEPPAS